MTMSSDEGNVSLILLVLWHLHCAYTSFDDNNLELRNYYYKIGVMKGKTRGSKLFFQGVPLPRYLVFTLGYQRKCLKYFH